MNADDLKRRLGLILAQEEGPNVDWTKVAEMSAQLSAECGPSLDPIAAGFLECVEQRRSDPLLAQSQRSQLVLYLRGLKSSSNPNKG